MFDMDFNEWGNTPRPKRKAPSRAYRQFKPKTRTKIVYVQAPRRKSPRTAYRQKQPQGLSLKEAYGGAKKVYKGAKATYKGTKIVYGKAKKVYGRTASPRLTTLKEKLRGSIYKKEGEGFFKKI